MREAYLGHKALEYGLKSYTFSRKSHTVLNEKFMVLKFSVGVFESNSRK